MVDSRFLVTVSKPSDRRSSTSPTMAAATPLALTGNQLPHPNQTHLSQRNRKQAGAVPNSVKIPPCHRSHEAAADAVVLIAILFAVGFLVLPYLQLFYRGLAGVGVVALAAVRAELDRAPIAYLLLCLSFLVLAIAVFGILRCTFSGNKCDNPNCRGLRNAVEFDIQIETEEIVKNSSCSVGRDGSGRALFELNEGHHRQLEAELKKLAPPNGRAVLIFRARCGCSVGRMVVCGPKKVRKVKK